MLIACLWSHWQGKGEPDLLSFAAVTDDPPEEISLAGHDRCIIPIKHEHIDEWLNPDRRISRRNTLFLTTGIDRTTSIKRRLEH